jgi:serine protease inhibitor
MIIVLPDAIDGVGEVGGRLDAQELPQLFAALNSRVARRPDLAMPRFKASFKAELAKPFQQAGMIRAFNRRRPTSAA